MTAGVCAELRPLVLSTVKSFQRQVDEGLAQHRAAGLLPALAGAAWEPRGLRRRWKQTLTFEISAAPPGVSPQRRPPQAFSSRARCSHQHHGGLF